MTRRTGLLLAILAGGAWSAWYLELSPAQLAPGPGGLQLFGKFFAAALNPSFVAEGNSGIALLPQVLAGARATVVFAAAGMTLALVLGMVLGFFASTAWWSGDLGGRTTWWFRLRRIVGPAIYGGARLLIAFLRSIHELLWALLFLSALGLSNATAVVAIALPYGGTLAKIFSEMIDEAPRDAARALRGLGAPPLAVFWCGLVPRALPDMAAYAFYRFECALRSSAVLGFFGFPTLGYYIKASFDHTFFGEVWLYLYALFALVVLVDWWSGALRRRVVAA